MRTPVRDLAGKNVFVTGAASGIGRAVASAAAREGAVLFLTDVDAQRLLATVEDIRTSAGEVAYAAPADISDHDAVRAIAAEVTATPRIAPGGLRETGPLIWAFSRVAG